MNTRLQVEHPVTEAVTGRDLVADQLAHRRGRDARRSLAWSSRRRRRATRSRRASTPRIPSPASCPRPGASRSVRWPAGVRIDTGVAQGDAIGDRYDPMLAKVIAHGPTRGRGARTAACRARRDDGAGGADEPEIPPVAARAAGDARRRRCGPTRSPASSCPVRRPRGPSTGRPPRASRADGSAGSVGRRVAPQRSGHPPPAPRRTRSGPSRSTARRHPSPRPATDRPSTSTSRDRASSSPSHSRRAWSRRPLTPPAAVEGASVLVAPMPGRVIAVRATRGRSGPGRGGHRRHRGDEDGARRRGAGRRDGRARGGGRGRPGRARRRRGRARPSDARTLGR